jgi:hypothetical protein
MRNPLGGFAAGALDPIILAERIGLVPDPWQEKILRHPAQRDLLNCHRQSGKSTVAAIAAVHAAIYVPHSTVLIVAPALRQAQELLRVATTIFAAIDRPFEDEESTLTLRLSNGSRVVTVPADATTSRGWSGVKLLIFDEASRIPDEVYGAMTPFVAVSKGRILALSTPFGKQGWWHAASQSKGWRQTTVPVTDCKRISAEYLEEQRAEHGELHYRSEWLCEYVDAYGRMFSTDDIDAGFALGRMGAIPPGALFAGLTPASPALRIVTAPAVRVTRCPRDPDGLGIHKRERGGGDTCMACGQVLSPAALEGVRV